MGTPIALDTELMTLALTAEIPVVRPLAIGDSVAPRSYNQFQKFISEYIFYYDFAKYAL
jgi:hypothetical protein